MASDVRARAAAPPREGESAEGNGAESAEDRRLRPWLAALRDLVPMPDRYRELCVGRDEARALLGCANELLDELAAHGLTHAGSGEDLRFDYHDLANVALYSGAATSVPLAGQRMMLRFASGSPDTWTPTRHWTLDWRLRCREPECPGGTWRVTVPTPEVFGGRLDELECEQPAVREDGDLVVRGAASVRLTGRVTTSGSRSRLLSATARRHFEDLREELRGTRYRFQWMHPRLRTDRAETERLGIMDCTVCALELQRRAEADGLTTRTRRGRYLGVLDAEHAWCEVLDEDGVFKPVDPVFAVLSERHRPPHEEFDDFCAGSVPSRFLPWSVPAGSPLATHDCPVGDGSWDNTFSGTTAKGNA
ncbi:MULTISPECIES: hypothetical protein [unclassified Streptomyces]|uniref:hypothetical protein n=1 Tax=unclassified Streptomyces TaxID=2593676 RepID=UPI0022B69FB8|nr:MULTISPECIES: hypothetical protein [unclassified Streptomyces]MCZ7417813.1 hypothetical protein [Streptomyces sp. WMMC897]MCZ7432382.1 hypothetical protein [Streptomyces sp. WMMC1477]